MKGNILKKIIAAMLILTFVSGAVPLSPFSDITGGTIITANAILPTSVQIGDYVFEKDTDNHVLIQNTNDWNNLAEAVKDGDDCSGYTFLMTDDLSVSRPIGQQTENNNDSRMRFRILERN